jgi:hypothetical protein
MPLRKLWHGQMREEGKQLLRSVRRRLSNLLANKSPSEVCVIDCLRCRPPFLLESTYDTTVEHAATCSFPERQETP